MKMPTILKRFFPNKNPSNSRLAQIAFQKSQLKDTELKEKMKKEFLVHCPIEPYTMSVSEKWDSINWSRVPDDLKIKIIELVKESSSEAIQLHTSVITKIQ